MQTKKLTKKDYINEILRLSKILVQCKYDSDDDKNIKRLIDENFRNLGQLEASEYQDKIDRQSERNLKKSIGVTPFFGKHSPHFCRRSICAYNARALSRGHRGCG